MMYTNCRLLLTTDNLLELLSVYLHEARRPDIDFARDCISIPFYNPELPLRFPGAELPVIYYHELK